MCHERTIKDSEAAEREDWIRWKERFGKSLKRIGTERIFFEIRVMRKYGLMRAQLIANQYNL